MRRVEGSCGEPGAAVESRGQLVAESRGPLWRAGGSCGELGGSCGEPGAAVESRGQLQRAGGSAQDVLGHECMLRCWFVEIRYKSFSHSNPL